MTPTWKCVFYHGFRVLPIILFIHATCANGSEADSIESSHHSDRSSQYNPGDYINIGFSDFSVAEAKQEEHHRQEKYTITAILTHTNDPSNMIKQIKALLANGHFKEIIVLHDDHRKTLIIEQELMLNHVSSPTVRLL